MIRKLLIRGFFILLGVVAAAWVGTWVWLVTSKDILNHPLASLPIYPLACTTRGCITSASTLNFHQRAVAFSFASLTDAPTFEESLSTVIRRHLAKEAFLRSPVTLADAKRYREEILHITSEDKIKEVASMSVAQYDEDVLVPFLQQEALRQQHSVESTEELYGILSSQRRVFLLPYYFRWDTDRGQVVSK